MLNLHTAEGQAQKKPARAAAAAAAAAVVTRSARHSELQAASGSCEPPQRLECAGPGPVAECLPAQQACPGHFASRPEQLPACIRGKAVSPWICNILAATCRSSGMLACACYMIHGERVMQALRSIHCHRYIANMLRCTDNAVCFYCNPALMCQPCSHA